MKVGILGSSHSTGRHKLHDGSVTPLFTHWLEKYKNPGYTFYNCANGGMGSECFLQSIVRLKSTYDIDIALIESIHNRKNINADIAKPVPSNNDIYKLNSNRWEIAQDVENLEDLTEIFEFPNHMAYKFFIQHHSQDKIIKLWKRASSAIANQEQMNKFWTSVDHAQTIELCHMLKIKIVWWNHSKLFVEDKIDNLIKSKVDYYVDFKGYKDATTYLSRQYPGKHLFCDVAHFKPKYEEEVIRDFLLPGIESFQNTTSL